MLPVDMVALLLSGRTRRVAERDELRGLIVRCVLSPLVCMLSIVLSFRLLKLLEFTVTQPLTGALALLFGTTFLHYTQNMMENNLVLR